MYPVEGDNSEVTARLKIVEESLNSIMTSEKMKINNLQSDPTVRTTLKDKKEVKQNQLECTPQLVANGDTWADIVGENAKPLDTIITEENIGDNGWTNVSSKNQKEKTWRQRLNILRGTATSESDSEVLSADIHLVAFGVAKHVSGIQLSHFLEGKGLHVLSCDLLTKYEGARSLSYKVTIKSCDFDKAKNPELWPYRVGVRLFKFFNARNERKDVSGARFQAGRQYENTPRMQTSMQTKYAKPPTMQTNMRTQNVNLPRRVRFQDMPDECYV